MDAGRQDRRYPGYTLKELELTVARCRDDNCATCQGMKAEIDARKTGSSKPFVTPTGRTPKGPNVQGIAPRTEEAAKIRGAIFREDKL